MFGVWFETVENEWCVVWRHQKSTIDVDNDVPVAICHLGTSYAEGCYGLKPSPKKAALLFQRAAELGNAMAMVWLAHAHHRGEGVERDETKAFEYPSSVFFCHSVL